MPPAVSTSRARGEFARHRPARAPLQAAMLKPGGLAVPESVMTRVSDTLARDLAPPPSQVVQVGVAEIDAAKASGHFAHRNGPVSFAPALGVKVYRATDAIIKNDPLRNWLSGDGSAWLDTSGVFETRKHYGVALPVGETGLAVQAGFDASALVQYRTIVPYELGIRSVEKLLQWNPISIPNSVDKALDLPRGSEFALRGSGAVAGHSSITGGPLTLIGGTTLGVGVKAGSVIKMRGDVELDVLRLAGDKIRVTLRRSKVSTRQMGAELLAGVADARGTLPGWGEGLLLRLMRFSGSRLLLAAVKKYGSVRAFTQVEDGKHCDNACHFEFDLSVPEAARAYERVFSLDFSTAEQLAMVSQHGLQSGVKTDQVVTTTDYDSASRLVSVLGAKVLLSQSLHLESHGVHTDMQGRQLLTRKSLLRRQYQDIARGSLVLDWEVVQARRGDGHYEPYFHLTYNHRNKVTLPQQVEALFRFADALGDREAEHHRIRAQSAMQALSRQSWARKVFSTRDNTDTDMDLYFTTGGIAHIAQASEAEIFRAYITAVGKLDGAMERMPLIRAPELATPLLSRMSELNRCWWWTSAQAQEAGEVAERYQVMFERNIATDGQVYEAAKKVSTSVDSLRDVLAHGDEEARGKAVSGFFMGLGQRLGFKFAPIIATLAQLAGEHGTLVHKLSLSGAGIKFASAEGPAIREPSGFMPRMLRFQQNRSR